jgi:hypothetical protein
MLLARLDSPFEHPDWVFEPKLDGFRALAYVEGGDCRLVSRNRNAFKTFEPLAQAISQELSAAAPSWTARSCVPGRMAGRCSTQYKRAPLFWSKVWLFHKPS